MKLDDLTIAEKVGQKFIVGVNSHNIDLIIRLIREYYIGGVILYKKNYNNYEEMLSVIKRLKDANKDNKIPLFISIDQEGGRVNRMPSEFKNLKNIYDISKSDKDLIFDSVRITGKMLYDTGINMNFAPVMDIYDGKNKLLYKRCFSTNIDVVSDNGLKYVKGLEENGVISVVKHFPGHGATKTDSHFFTPYVFNYKDILDKHMLPFEKAIKEGVDAVMLGHLVIRKITNGLPVSISSRFIKKYLREKNKFGGLVITDEINMLSRNIFYRFIYMKRAFLSGSDMILLKLKDNGCSIFDKLNKLITKNVEYQMLVNDSVERIIKIKNKYRISDEYFDGCNIDLINKDIENLNNLCSND